MSPRGVEDKYGNDIVNMKGQSLPLLHKTMKGGLTGDEYKLGIPPWRYIFERINVTDNQNIEIIWKFDDLFATA